MIDFNNLEKYRENNRIEAKKAMGGLPGSIWETYSAFANTLGGVILLGVEEWPDKTLHAVDLPDPDKLIKEFWNNVNNPNKTSVNLLSSKDVFVQEVDGNHIVVINVPRAERSYRPVYLDGNPLSTYRRNGEGDYKCTKEEYQAMVRDASVKTQDMLVLNEMDMSVFNKESVRSYRQRMRLSRPGHVWEALEDEDFLMKLGAVGIGSDGKKHPIKRHNGAFEREIVPFDMLKPQFVQPNKDNPRILKQDGAFIVSGLDENDAESDMKIRKYLANEVIVPHSVKKAILDELEYVGINQATLFPEVDKVADYLRQKP